MKSPQLLPGILLPLLLLVPGASSWGHDGHLYVCTLAQGLLLDEAAETMKKLLPDWAGGSMPSVCSWADLVGHTAPWRWSLPLHYVDTPDGACSYDFSRDCHYGPVQAACAVGAINNYTQQLAKEEAQQQLQQHILGEDPAALLETPQVPVLPNTRSPLSLGYLLSLLGTRSACHAMHSPAAAAGQGQAQGEAEQGLAARPGERRDKWGWRRLGMASKDASMGGVGGQAEEEGESVLEGRMRAVRGSLEAWTGRLRAVEREVELQGGIEEGERGGPLAQSSPSSVHDDAVARQALRVLQGAHGEGDMEGGGSGTKGDLDPSLFNPTTALMFLLHFVGDIHQPLHVGFTSDYGGNRIKVHWYSKMTNLHEVWDNEIIKRAVWKYHGNSPAAFVESLARRLSSEWLPLIPAWASCPSKIACPNAFARESLKDACQWAYSDVKTGDTLDDAYFEPRVAVVELELAKAAVRLAAILNRLFSPPPPSPAVA